jgi:hypothetical protein
MIIAYCICLFFLLLIIYLIIRRLIKNSGRIETVVDISDIALEILSDIEIPDIEIPDIDLS